MSVAKEDIIEVFNTNPKLKSNFASLIDRSKPFNSVVIGVSSKNLGEYLGIKTEDPKKFIDDFIDYIAELSTIMYKDMRSARDVCMQWFFNLFFFRYMDVFITKCVEHGNISKDPAYQLTVNDARSSVYLYHGKPGCDFTLRFDGDRKEDISISILGKSSGDWETPMYADVVITGDTTDLPCEPIVFDLQLYSFGPNSLCKIAEAITEIESAKR